MTVVTVTVGQLQENCYLVSDENGHTLCIDPGAEANRILHSAAQHGMHVEAIVLTHAHFDHIGAVDALRAATGAPLWVPREDAAMLADPAMNLSAYGEPLCVAPAERELDEGDTFSIGSLCFTVWHTAGHTAGSSSYVCDAEKTVFTGDTMFADAYGRTDFPSGSTPAMFASLKRLRRGLRGYTAYAGHGAAFQI